MPGKRFRLFITMLIGVSFFALSFHPDARVGAAGTGRITQALTGQPFGRRTSTPTLTLTQTLTPTIIPSITITLTFTPTITTTPSFYEPSSVELVITPETVHPGDAFTLNFTYHNLGIPYTYINIDPPELVDYDPYKINPCRFGSDPTGCTAITLRAKAKGTVGFSVYTSGEIWDGTCWRWGDASTGASLTITDDSWPLFLPFAQK